MLLYGLKGKLSRTCSENEIFKSLNKIYQLWKAKMEIEAIRIVYTVHNKKLSSGMLLNATRTAFLTNLLTVFFTSSQPPEDALH